MLVKNVTSWQWQHNEIKICSGGVALSDRGFRYGQHLFETLAIRNGKILFFEEHWEQLMQAAQRHHFPINNSWYQEIDLFLKKEIWNDGILRIFLTAGEGNASSFMVSPNLFLFWEEADFPSEKKLREGMKIISLDHPIGTRSWGEKTGNYWSHLHGLETARNAGADEGLIFDQDDFLISATMANVILWIEDGSIITPSYERGARDGVILGWVRHQLPALIECDVKRNDFKKVTGMALTNSRIGVAPVATLDGKDFFRDYSIFRLAETYLKNFL